MNDGILAQRKRPMNPLQEARPGPLSLGRFLEIEKLGLGKSSFQNRGAVNFEEEYDKIGFFDIEPATGDREHVWQIRIFPS
jgi:hypothetical protein